MNAENSRKCKVIRSYGDTRTGGGREGVLYKEAAESLALGFRETAQNKINKIGDLRKPSC